ncbi:MAG: phosphoribosylformylglycinamidine synthase [Frankiales bacterium]|nr:phosphoribosylformylglycinamidine synthase [Frankiales bacterium]
MTAATTPHVEATLDTVEIAAASPDRPQRYRELGVADDEYLRIKEILGRRPTDTELAMYSVMWSEHCSYKSSKVHLRQFGDKAPKTERLLVGMGENAGVVDVGNGIAVTFKIESHNHPSYVEPYQGAATGVGGIIRDILTMGARPIAVMDSLRFGDPADPDTARLVHGIVSGVGGYGNCVGLPNIGGEVVFDASYQGNPLVNALCVGVLPSSGIKYAKAEGAGNSVILIGAKTGRDGMGGASILASATFEDDGGPAKRPSVQVGDPFTEKVLIECCLELFERDLVTGIQDLGAAGLTCATTETAAAGDGGMHIYLERVPLREASMVPLEMLMSESQERMLAIVTPENTQAVLDVCARWGALATVIGEVTDGETLQMTWHGELVVDLEPRPLAHDGPVYNRPIAKPTWIDALQADEPSSLKRPASGAELRDTLLQLASSPNLCSRGWVTDQYDRFVLGNTALAQPDDAGVIRLDETTGRGIALATDGNGRYGKLDPYAGAQLALSEAYRNVAVSGAEPIAVTNCLNFGSPEDPEVMWQFQQAVTGLADACLELGTPVTGGNVSFYNQTGSTAVHPTPVIGVLGVIDDVADRLASGWQTGGLQVWLLGTTRDEFGGSEWAHVAHGHLGGVPPQVDLDAERRLARVLREASRGRLVAAAHDLSDGGLAQTLVESCLRYGIGATIALPDGADPFVALFSESVARAVVAVPVASEQVLAGIAAEHGIVVTKLGVTGGGSLVVDGLFDVDVDDLRDASEGTLPRLFG